MPNSTETKPKTFTPIKDAGQFDHVFGHPKGGTVIRTNSATLEGQPEGRVPAIKPRPGVAIKP